MSSAAILFRFTAGTIIWHASSTLQTGGGACGHPTAPFASPGVLHAHRTEEVAGPRGREGENGVGGGIGVGGGNVDGNGVGGGNRDVNGDENGDGAGTETRVETNEGMQDENGAESEDGVGSETGTGLEAHRRACCDKPVREAGKREIFRRGQSDVVPPRPQPQRYTPHPIPPLLPHRTLCLEMPSIPDHRP